MSREKQGPSRSWSSTDVSDCRRPTFMQARTNSLATPNGRNWNDCSSACCAMSRCSTCWARLPSADIRSVCAPAFSSHAQRQKNSADGWTLLYPFIPLLPPRNPYLLPPYSPYLLPPRNPYFLPPYSPYLLPPRNPYLLPLYSPYLLPLYSPFFLRAFACSTCAAAAAALPSR